MSKRKGWWKQLQTDEYEKTRLDYGDVNAVSYKPKGNLSNKSSLPPEIRKTQDECPNCHSWYWLDKMRCSNCGWHAHSQKTISPLPEQTPINTSSHPRLTNQSQKETLNKHIRPSINKSVKQVTIYTDGACIGNPGPGGYGAVLIYGDHRKELSGGYRLTTNNRMEIMAVIAALSALKTRCQVDLFSDSQYVVNAMTKGWVSRWKARNWMRTREEKAKNPDLWQKVLDLCSRHQVTFHWIKGHNNHLENDRCDTLAVAAATGADLPPDKGYEAGFARQPSGF